jgi:serine/threonine protein kinase/TolA-binding protein
MQKLQIDASTWTALNRLLDEALDQPAHEREGWIEKLAPEFAGVTPRLRALLSRAAQIETDDALNTLPKVELAPGDLEQVPTHRDQPGDEIGPYRLLRELGSGGMGVVWLAERTDGLIARPVALKLPHGAWKRAGLAERMTREREILATLTHPNIAHLYDAGLTAEGQPYLAIEYVEGVRIDVYCSEQHLDVKARLALFAQVAQAVAYAHGKLVVHRDLKPANILVNGEGQARLLDFGIAKLLDDGQIRETRFTEASGRALTPDYASPEQILGEPLTISSDVYSLGVVLYELVSGRRPYKLVRNSRGALEDAIVQAEPAAASAVADKPAQRFLRGDLDTIVLKALKKKPAERYPTVHALLDDIERFFAGRPVQAQPDSSWYRTKRFVGRNKLAIGASSAILLAVLVGAGIAAWQARVAVAEQNRAEQVKEFVASIFREASPYSGAGTTTLSAIDLLKQAEKKLGADITEQPKVRIELLALIGESLMALSDLDAAEPVLNRAATEARQALDEFDGMAVSIALLQAQMHRLRGRAKAARAELDRILPALRSDPTTKPLDLAGALSHRTLIALEEGAFADAERFALEGANLANTKLGIDHEQTLTSSILLALTYRYTKKFAQSRDAAEMAYQAAVARFGAAPPHPRVTEAKTTYGRALADTGELAAGIAMIDAAVVDLRTLTGPDSSQVGIFLQNLVAYRIDLGELVLADNNAAEALRIISAKVETESMTFAGTLSARAQARLARRDAGAALEEFNRAIPILERMLGAERESTLLARTGRALALAYLGRLDEAQLEIAAVSKIVAPKDALEPLGARVAQVRGTIARMRGNLPAALQAQSPIAALKDGGPKLQRERMRALAEIGLINLEMNNAATGAATLELALAEFKRLESSITPSRADALIGLGRTRLAQDRAVDALPSLEMAHAFWRDFAPANRWAGEAALWLGQCYLALGRKAEAREALSRAETLLAASPLPADAKLLKLAVARPTMPKLP